MLNKEYKKLMEKRSLYGTGVLSLESPCGRIKFVKVLDDNMTPFKDCMHLVIEDSDAEMVWFSDNETYIKEALFKKGYPRQDLKDSVGRENWKEIKRLRKDLKQIGWF